MIKRTLCLVGAVALLAGAASAKDIRFGVDLAQEQFKELSKEAGVALSYKNVAPTAPLGLTGFDIGVEATAIDIEDKAFYWQAAFEGDAPSHLVIPRVRVRKGLPFGIDIGAMYTEVPNSNVKLYGGEISKAILDGTAATPALGVRATYTKLSGVDDLDFQTVGVDASISKGFLIVTPYVGAGAVYVMSEAKGQLQELSTAAGSPLKEEKFWQPRVFGGLELKPLPFFRLLAEAEYSERPNYSLKLAVGF